MAHSTPQKLWYLPNHHDALQAHMHLLHKLGNAKTGANYHAYYQNLIKDGTAKGAASNAYLTSSNVSFKTKCIIMQYRTGTLYNQKHCHHCLAKYKPQHNNLSPTIYQLTKSHESSLPTIERDSMRFFFFFPAFFLFSCLFPAFFLPFSSNQPAAAATICAGKTQSLQKMWLRVGCTSQP